MFKTHKQYRLPDADYSANGGYYVTICAHNHQCVFGDIINQKVELSSVGKIAHEFWEEIPNHVAFVKLDKFVIMPDHMHGILFIENKNNTNNFPRRHGQLTVPTKHTLTILNPLQPQPDSLSIIIRTYKGAVTARCREKFNINPIWQPRFHDHIIRDENDLNRIREYIINNPENWEFNKLNPEKFV